MLPRRHYMFKKKTKELTIEVEKGVVTPLYIPKGVTLKVIDWDIQEEQRHPDVHIYS
jgi:hypothetical protein